MNKKQQFARRALPKRSALVVALAMGMGLGGVAYGQATTGTVFGTAPAGDSVTVTGHSNGVTRTVSVGSDGRYSVSNLPVGTYTVTLTDNGQAISSRNDVTLRVGAGTQISFAGNTNAESAQSMSGVEVTANALPAIDVSSVSSSSIINAQELQQLPVQHSAESIALLAPGTVSGSGYFGSAVSFGGAGVTENAYYVNGFNTTNIYNATGASYQLPYGAISQQETFTGGYDAKYGRSDGGVINQIGARGTNEWTFGGRATWAPRFLQASPKNLYYPHQDIPGGYDIVDADKQGKLRRYRNANKQWETQYAAYLGGPLIKDTLFMYLAAEKTKSEHRSVAGVDSQQDSYYDNREDNIYAKFDWNINDSNILQLTGMHDVKHQGAGTDWRFDNDTLQDTALIGERDVNKYALDAYIVDYTSYITDQLTFHASYGQIKRKNPVLYPFVSENPGISASGSQNPAYWTNGKPIVNDQTGFYVYSPDAKQNSTGLRADLSYQLGDHLLEAGIDNVKYHSMMQGQTMSGPGYAWIYSKGDPAENINAKLGVGAPGSEYYVARYIYSVASSMGADQKAWYIQDAWQITDNVLFKFGIRNDNFTNQNNVGQDFVKEDNQWEPRLGISWDVFGDSSLKIYGNAGRYYLALPQSVALRAATPSTFTYEYFTYDGIDANGNPTGRTPVPGVNGAPAPGPVSANNETGTPVNPHTVTATDLKPQYQDEFIVGFDKTLGDNWVYGAKATYRELGTAIDDICDMDRIAAKIDAMGLDSDDYAYGDPGCRIFNPGRSNSFIVNSVTGGDPINVQMSKSDWGLSKGAERKYYGLDLYLSHPFDNNWYLRVDYTFSRSWGNQEGQVRSDIGQTDTSKTEDWDFASLMDGAYGYLANHRRHQLKLRAAWQITPEWLLSGTARVQSGTPRNCLSFYGPDASDDPAGYGNDYHWCGGHRSPPGDAGFTPWTKQIDLGVRYMPNFADNKLAFKLDVFNALNEQKAIQVDPHRTDGVHTISNTYGAGIYFEQPRYMRLSVSYDY